jgi:hypothetical protein
MPLRLVPVALVCAALALESAAAPPDLQPTSQPVVARPAARIDSVSQKFPNLAIHLIASGTRFPAKAPERALRLAAVTPSGSPGSDVAYLSGNRSWTSTRIEDFLPFDLIAGKPYRVAIVEAGQFSPVEWKAVSNEVEYLLLMNLDRATPSPVPLGTGEITITTANKLGPRGGKVVKMGGKEAPVASWGTPAGDFRIAIPHGLMRPAEHQLWVEESGKRVSDVLTVTLLGPALH